MSARPISALFALLLAGLSGAASAADYTLNDGVVRFSAPGDWPVIMQMSEGNPQVIAFQVKDPADTGTGEATRVTVTTRKLDDAQAFQAFVNTALEKARQTPGYESETGADGSSLRYSGMSQKTRYKYRESYFYRNGVAVQLRCVHPVLAATSPAWIAAYNQGCDQIAASLQK
ncbi:MAG: hypothetical protein BGP24_00420 [Lysobacterales bacterium 69-70]|nr:hypothetical protein [Xanthomonadaceae bacterium]ODU36223.1 MAG: hypothetical protein ABS97_02550 [Xanthomonadaceae bacterium SCN 69-320]ODV17925.1 MAG: hypothetical protein ABT27_15835 [Xanthomonadaceae bacterium SCN 69-25]OJY99319.1 MAG: hypothetical protein BGP24_00420 [Xanthomonadales bacterium 69-70]